MSDRKLNLSEMLSKTPLFLFDSIRPRILQETVENSLAEYSSRTVENELTAALYLEKQRLRREKKSVFTRVRIQNDQRLWVGVQHKLLKTPMEEDRQQILRNVLEHYAEEVGGHFSQSVYRFATHALPTGFNMLLNASSLKTLMVWKWYEEVRSRLTLTGEIEHLRRMADRGTVLLVPTHQSNIDSILIGYVIYLMGLPPFAYGAGLNLFSNPILRFFMSNLGAYTVDRAKNNQLYKEYLKNYSVRILEEGIHSIFFPGGGRSRSGAIENKLKLGLLGTGLQAQILKTKKENPKPKVYIVPMVTSYHFVLEAGSLIEDYLSDLGKHRYLVGSNDHWNLTGVMKFFWRFFRSQSNVTIRVGSPLDVFGNPVDWDGNSIGPNGTVIEPQRWLTTRGIVGSDPGRDHEYTRELGNRIGESFHRGNTVLSSHAVAFCFFELLREKYPDLDLYRLLRVSLEQRTQTWPTFLNMCERVVARLKELEKNRAVFLDPIFHSSDTHTWVEDGVKHLGAFHGSSVLVRKEQIVYTEDMNLIYYYRNRLSGYGLSRLSDPYRRVPGILDAQGFLA